MPKRIRDNMTDYFGSSFDRAKHVFHSPGFQEIIDSAVNFFSVSPVYQLPPSSPFLDAGVYALYYKGRFSVYQKLAALNSSDFIQPIYIGKAVPPGWRKARLSRVKEFESLYGRLREHARSIQQVENLAIGDFYCRFVILENEEASLIGIVEAELIRKFKPLWNSVVDGFGNHDPGSGRYNQRISEWDTLHPGRLWARKLTGGFIEIENIERKVKEALMAL